MLRIAAFALLLVAAASAANVQVAPKVTPRGPIEGVISCGSAGTLLEVRVTDCDKLPCDVYQKESYVVEVDFIPSKTYDGFNVKATIIQKGQEYPYINQDKTDRLQAGVAYTVTYPITATDMLPPGAADVRVELGKGTDRELCGVASCTIHPPKFFYKN